eukprot:CAMPEP_0204523676 /NCGR_PEP_ID=MMETSP0661-20131031/6964_1 /ASSEMBLY_ACC=CAM_ASM_000606 /TAXON_ID=109239 /ORGANISM="Alexandrium margalefi, Strain AMGDE01CS-322" /LENGTH=325 /DNA_ID=CAMNT_0051529381 /DNA_START=39 /DNA_END=1016 /DNA_ORIENTATION=-
MAPSGGISALQSRRLHAQRRPALARLDVGALKQSVVDQCEDGLARQPVDTLIATGDRDMQKEFMNIDDFCNRQRSGDARPRLSRFHPSKDFCESVLPFEQFRAETVDGSYINASKMEGIYGRSFIAAQGPLSRTVEDFWSMVAKHRVSQIVALCADDECADYVPRGEEQFSFLEGALTVRCINDEAAVAPNEIGLWRSRFEVCLGEDHWEVERVQCSVWADQKVLPAASLLSLAELVNTLGRDSTTVVHCRAGAGRTGCLLALCSMLVDLETQLRKIPDQTPCVSILRAVVSLRSYRPHMVQTSEQYEVLYAAVRAWYTRQGENH